MKYEGIGGVASPLTSKYGRHHTDVTKHAQQAWREKESINQSINRSINQIRKDEGISGMASLPPSQNSRHADVAKHTQQAWKKDEGIGIMAPSLTSQNIRHHTLTSLESRLSFFYPELVSNSVHF